MCIAVFIWKTHPLYPFLLFLNRDEFHHRPTKPLAWWEGSDDDDIVGGRDEVAGGTWLACTRSGRVAFLTNVREIKSSSDTKSRGDLPVRFLKSDKSPHEFSEQLLTEAGQYSGFNLIVADVCSMTMVYITNRPKGSGMSVTEVSPGIHVLSNANLDSPWPKCQRLECSFKQLLDEYGDSEIPLGQAAERLMRDVTKEGSNLPEIYPHEFEYQLSSIFIDTETSMGRYGTRSTSSLAATSSGEVTFYEVHLESDVWKEQQITFMIDKGTDGVVSVS